MKKNQLVMSILLICAGLYFIISGGQFVYKIRRHQRAQRIAAAQIANNSHKKRTRTKTERNHALARQLIEGGSQVVGVTYNLCKSFVNELR